MSRLAGYLRDHSGPLEADLRREYQVDLLDFWRGTISARRLGVYAAQLPPGSSLWRSIGDDHAWSQEGHLIAEVIDALKGLEAQSAGQKKYERFLRPAQQRALAELQANKLTGVAYAEDNARRYLERQRQTTEEQED